MEPGRRDRNCLRFKKIAFANKQKKSSTIMKLVKYGAIILMTAVVFICSCMETMLNPFKTERGKNDKNYFGYR
jgi:hypothetical protein